MIDFIQILSGLGFLAFVRGHVACKSSSFCESKLRPDSICQAGFCTNPFTSGCLRNINGKESFANLRVCNSEDEYGAANKGICSAPSSYFNYTEIRIAPGDWESSMFTSWIIQIMLSEILNVPTTIHVGGDGKLNFYDMENSLDYPEIAYDWRAIEEANLHECDCRETMKDCANVLPEVWQEPTVPCSVEGHLNGLITYNGFYMPKYTVDEYPSLASFWGLRGEVNREKLAGIFKRPTTWLQYCDEVSETKCNKTDDTASRRPIDKAEEKKYFAGEGLYKGHFRATNENNCTLNPSNCSGFLFGFPCHWTTQRHTQLFWNEIAVNWTASFTYEDLSQIFQAANATRSHIFIEWWYPEPRIENYQRIQLPDASRECIDNRIERETCLLNETELRGSQKGACDYFPKPVQRIYNSKLSQMSNGYEEVQRSPAYEFLRKFKISDFDMRDILNNWMSLGFDQYNYDPREAVCSWVSNNLENGTNLIQYAPQGYPRQIVTSTSMTEPSNMILSSLNMGLAIIISLGVMSAGLATYYHRKTPVMKCAQPHFLYLFCLGFFFVPIGSLFYIISPKSDCSCMFRHWFVLTGYTLGRVPLLVKVAAINKMALDSQRYQRREITQTRLFIIVGLLLVITILFLSVWSIYDPDIVQESMALRTGTPSVDVYIYCSSSKKIWRTVSYVWESMYILGSVILAHQSRNVVQEFNESKDLVKMAYVSSMFLVFRLMISVSTNNMVEAFLRGQVTGLFLSLDAFLNIFVYFGPKFLLIYKREAESQNPIPGKSHESGSSKVSWVSISEKKNELKSLSLAFHTNLSIPAPHSDKS